MLNLRRSFDLKCLATQVTLLQRRIWYDYKNFCTKPEEKKVEFSGNLEDSEDPEEVAAREALIEKKRNKSKLIPADFNKQNDRKPYNEPLIPYHESLKFRRRLYGKYGEDSHVNPSILWPSVKELEAMKTRESVAQPFTFQELVARSQEKKRLAEKERLRKEAEGLEKVKNIQKEIFEFHKRVAIKKEAAMKLMEKQNRLFDEVRKRIGFKLSVHDQKFKEVLAVVEKEEKKKLKAAKKALKEEKKSETNKEEISEAQSDSSEKN